ncbi:hypothetical protein MRX96_057058 [Rhipicephalus microplus]
MFDKFDASTHQALLLLAAGAGILILWARRNAASSEEKPGIALLKNIHCDYIVHLKERKQVTHNTVLGCAVGQHVYLSLYKGERLLVRPYTPVSLCDQRGTFDIIIKVYRQGTSLKYPDGGIMSQTLDSLLPGDPVQIQGPKGKFEYIGRGRFLLDKVA